MRVVWLTKFGDPSVLVAGDAPDPVPDPGQVVIDVAFANITFIETQFRATGAGPFKAEPPLIPGNGVGGVISAVGPDTDTGLVGRRVVTSLNGTGGYASRVVVDATAPFEVPDGLALDDAVALLADGRTATMLIRAAALSPGERVLVEAAAGGVGSLAIQLAKAAGARVVAAAGGERKLALARELGADAAVDYRQPGWAAEAGALDVVLDGVGGSVAREAFELLVPGGRMLSYGLASGEWATIAPEEAASRGVELIRPRPTPQELRSYVESALATAAAGLLRPVIGQRFPLDRAADAHAAIESRATVGKTLLEVKP
ncbi:zinc-binding dehydrogenase [Phytohabitans houttuyneae]|uniref:zinc-binding dehydrogenase n=1 Tax=Phytohabitans houttuyneae TaxID=1076126 RepID=UPI0015642E5C|nr:zinc-binding dehydrogenase [Phytohabitans houttuyneae]